jgi:hypothetical protein
VSTDHFGTSPKEGLYGSRLQSRCSPSRATAPPGEPGTLVSCTIRVGEQAH